jgi:Arf-GAP/GTPase/ANK repeat/PH domain-containing protein 1/3
MLGSDNNNMKFIQNERSVSLQPMGQNSIESLQFLSLMPAPKEKELPTPTSTPTTSRKSRRRSNLFIPSSSKKDEKKSDLGSGLLGSGRSIPLKQGYLYKRSSKTLNKEWKKKYVTLCDDGRLTYHASLHDYMDNVHGKEISLQYVTVKVPGQKPRGSKSIITNSALIGKNGANNINNNNNNTNSITEGLGVLSLLSKDKRASSEKVTLTAYDSLKEHGGKASSHGSGDESGIHSNSNSQNLGSDSNSKIDAQTPNVKKRHRRMKSSGVKSNDIEGKKYPFSFFRIFFCFYINFISKTFF